MSKLSTHFLEILAMRRRGIGYRGIARALQEKGVKVHHSEVQRFLVRERRKVIALSKELGPFERLASIRTAQVDALINRPQKAPVNHTPQPSGKRIFNPPTDLDITQ